MSSHLWSATSCKPSWCPGPDLLIRSDPRGFAGYAFAPPPTRCDTMVWIDLSIVLFCLFVSAFFAASETALTSASRASMLRLSKQGNTDAAVVSELVGKRERLIGALLLGNNIANIGASALATGIL